MILKTGCETKTIKQTMHCRNVPVLDYEISYPVFSSTVFFKSVQRLNNRYRESALLFERYCRTALYRMACESAEEASKRGFSPIKFEAVQNFVLTYNENCALSLYFDRYMFTGGAHGMTERCSDSWELGSGGRRLEMKDMFKENLPYRDYVINEIIKIIAEDDSGTYFDDYEQNVKDGFNKENFYLTDSGLVVYFQQYDIAPYASGIPTFLLPYEKSGAMPPRC